MTNFTCDRLWYYSANATNAATGVFNDFVASRSDLTMSMYTNKSVVVAVDAASTLAKIHIFITAGAVRVDLATFSNYYSTSSNGIQRIYTINFPAAGLAIQIDPLTGAQTVDISLFGTTGC